MRQRLLGPNGPLGVFHQYPILLRLAAICVCAEIAWATLLIVLQYHFLDDLLKGEAHQYIVSRIATATLAFVAMETLFKIPMGALADRFGPRRLIFFALSISSLSPLLMVLISQFPDWVQWYHFIPLRALDGLGAAALWPAMSSLMALSVPREAKASAMGVFNGAYCLGLAVGPMTGLYLGHRFGNVSVFPLCAFLMMTGLGIASLVLRNGVGEKPPEAPDHVGSDFPNQGSVLKGRPMLVRMMALYALSQCGVGFLATTMVPYVDKQFGITEGDLPRLIAIPAIFIAVAALPLGRMADTMGRPRAVWISYVMAMLGMIFVATTSLMAPTHHLLSSQIVLFGLGMLLMVGSYILGTPAWLGLTSVQVDDARQGQALSLMQTAQGVGIVFSMAVVASGAHLMTRWDKVKFVVGEKYPKVAHALHWKFESHDTVPIHIWLWLAALIFAICLVGSILFVREPAGHEGDGGDNSARQPLEITGI